MRLLVKSALQSKIFRLWGKVGPFDPLLRNYLTRHTNIKSTLIPKEHWWQRIRRTFNFSDYSTILGSYINTENQISKSIYTDKWHFYLILYHKSTLKCLANRGEAKFFSYSWTYKPYRCYKSLNTQGDWIFQLCRRINYHFRSICPAKLTINWWTKLKYK